jgi:hypothetical protein
MAAKQKILFDKKGLVLFSSLLLVSLLMAAGMGAWIAIQNDYKITTNLRQATVGFYLAESGIEWAKQQIKQTSVHPPRLADDSKNFSSGTFSVVYLSSAALTSLSSKIVMRSTGSLGLSSQTIEVQLTKTYDLADSAIGLRGAATNVNLSGNSFFVSGFDSDPASGATVTGAKPRLAVSTSSAALRAQIEALVAPTSGVIIGGENNIPISESDLIPSATLTQLGDDLCRASHAVTVAVPVGATLSLANQSWGSRSAPELHCIETLSGSGSSVTVDGKFTGAGILVMRNVPLVANGSFRWEGLILVTGTGVSFRVVGDENKDIYGAIMINETGSALASPATLALEGAIRVFYSQSALATAANLIPSATLANIYGSLPSVITQNFWRSVNP